MGNNAIITVLGLAIIFSIINSTLNRNDKLAYESTYGYVEVQAASDIANSSIQITMRKIDTVKTLTSAHFPVSGNLDGGSYVVNGLIINDSTIKLTATSKFLNAKDTIRTTMVRHMIPLPPSAYKGTFGIYPNLAAGGFTYNGSAVVDGRDHDVNGNYLPLSADTVPPFLMRTAFDSTLVKAAIGASTNVIGNPRIKVDPAMSNVNASSDYFKSIADVIIPWSNPGNVHGTWGNYANPVIVFMDGTDNAGNSTRTFKINSNSEGWGILVVKGGLTLNGNLTWHGLVIEYGNTPLTFNGSNGTLSIYGAMMFGGLDGGTYTIGGNATFAHSSEALNILLKNLKNPYIYQFVDWYE